MLWYTHVTIGVAAGLAVIPASVSAKETIIAASVSAVAAFFPDIDTPHSKLGKRQSIASRAINLFFGHRGVMHSLVGCLAVLFLFKTISPNSIQYLSRYIGIGYISHILADMLNPAGIPLLWPIRKRFRIPLIRTGGLAEKMMFAIAAFFIATKIEKLFVF